MKITIKGKIIAEMPEKSGTGKNGKEWRKKEYVLTEPGQYVKNVCFEVSGERINSLGLAVGQVVEVELEIDARQWQDRWFNTITCWGAKILSVEDAQYSGDISPKEQTSIVYEKDDLPF